MNFTHNHTEGSNTSECFLCYLRSPEIANKSAASRKPSTVANFQPSEESLRGPESRKNQSKRCIRMLDLSAGETWSLLRSQRHSCQICLHSAFLHASKLRRLLVHEDISWNLTFSDIIATDQESNTCEKSCQTLECHRPESSSEICLKYSAGLCKPKEVRVEYAG